MTRRDQAYRHPSKTTEGFAAVAAAALLFLALLVALWPLPVVTP